VLVGFAWFVSAAAAPPSASPAHPPWKDIAVGGGRIDVGLNLRARYESLENFTIRSYDAGRSDDVVLLRARLSGDLRGAAGTRGFVELQDARYSRSRLALADFGQSSSYYDAFDLWQAYFEWKTAGAEGFGVKLGRQILLYGDRRVFAPAEWGNVGNYWWDGVKFSLHRETVQVDAFYAQRVLSEPKRWNFDHHPYHVAGVYARWRGLPVTLDAFYVVKDDWSGRLRGERGPGDETRHTFGLFSERPAGRGWDYGLFAAGQLGTYGRDDIRAFGTIARGGHTFPLAGKPRVGGEFSFASGDRDPQDGVHGTFDGIFGAMDIPYGWMNVVSWKNLADYALNLSVQPARSLTLSLDWHAFRLARVRDAWYWVSGKIERRDSTGLAGRALGQELDLILRWSVNRQWELLFGATRFFAGDYLRRTPGGHASANWAFAQVTASY